jgi:hypothetical protein
MKDINKRHIRGFLRDYINKKYILENIELLEPKSKDATLEDYGHTLQDIVDIIISTPLEIDDVCINMEKKDFWVHIDTELEDTDGDYLHLRIDGKLSLGGEEKIKGITNLEIEIKNWDEEVMIDLSNKLKDNKAIIAHILKHLNTLVDEAW